MKTPKDTDLREALRRKYAHEPQLPADLISRMKSQQKRRWLRPASAIAVAASVLLLIMLNTEKQQPEQQMPSIAEVVTEPQATAPTEVTGQKQPAMAHSEKPKPRRRQKPAVRKETTIETPAEEAVPVEMPAEDVFPEDRLLDTNNPYLIAAAQLQDVRARGERLDREVAMLMNRQ
ncbi:MAG: hypothetical protein IJ537_05490 [Bacteroidaceae bacterium]|nr:hypothetical protein [Bacteroidaceae bacterium]